MYVDVDAFWFLFLVGICIVTNIFVFSLLVYMLVINKKINLLSRDEKFWF